MAVIMCYLGVPETSRHDLFQNLIIIFRIISGEFLLTRHYSGKLMSGYMDSMLKVAVLLHHANQLVPFFILPDTGLFNLH